MLVLHGGWHDDALLVWGEDSAHPARPAAPARAAVRPHPGAAAEPALRGAVAALATAAGTAEPEKAESTELHLDLPGSADRPLPSPVLGPPPGATAPLHPAAMHRWSAPALRFRPAALPALAAVLGHTDGDTALGPGLRHFRAVAAFAERLADSGRLLPLLVGEPAEARWRPVLTGDDTAHFRALTAALPRSAAALHVPPAAEPPRTPPADLVFRTLCAVLDSTARHRARHAAAAGEGAAHRLARALTRADPVPEEGDPVQRARLGARLRSWAHACHHSGDRARLGFRLVEPERRDTASAPPGGAEEWRVEFWVRSDRDPSLHVPLRELWLGSGAAWLPADAESTALRDLARAARSYPALHRVRQDLAPASLAMGTGGAHAFIRDAAPALTAAGFEVVLPQWARGSTVGLHMDAAERPAPAGRGGIGVADLVDFQFTAVLGGHRVDLDQLAELARLKQPLVRLRGHWVHADPDQIGAALEFLRRRGSGTMRRDEALAMLLAPGGDTPPVTGIDADGALGALLGGGTERTITPMSTPAGFSGTLRPYQQRGASWLRFLGGLGLGAVLADDMGLGKTVQLLALLTDERAPGSAGPGPTLLICPVSLVGNWRREAARFAPGLRVHVHHGPDRPHGNALARLLGGTDLVVTTYGVVLRDSEELAAMPWHRVVCDEAQAVKNSGTRQARAVRALPAATRIALTGTPVENNVGELWSVMEFANPGLLGPRASFDARIAARAADPEQGPGEGAALLKRLTGPFILRRVKTDRTIISDLPAKHEMRTWCTLTPEQASLYQAAVADMTEQVDQADGIRRKGLVLATLARLKQICNHPAQFLGDGSALAGRSGKLARLEEILAEALAEGDKALCFTQYTALGERLAPYLAARLGRPVLWLHGGTPRPRREELMARFQDAAGPMVFLLSLKAAGTGLNLTAANHVVHIDRWWNPAVEDQATDRAFRIGQRRDVQVRKLVCTGTVEERVDDMIEAKKALAHSVVGTGEDWLGELSTAELRAAVRLSSEAVA